MSTPLEVEAHCGHTRGHGLIPPAVMAEPPTGAQREVEPHYNALRALYALAREAVQRYGGTLQPVVGAQIMAIFGAPLAQEDHARRAVLAALDLQQRLRQHPPAR